MMKHVPTQLIVGLGILLVGGGIVGGEFLLVTWYPKHKDAVIKETLSLTPYRDDSLGVEIQVAAGINKKVEQIAGGVRIYSPSFWSTGPSLTITKQPNPDQRSEFTPQELAIWETDGVQHRLPRYDYKQERINDRDAVLIWQHKNHAMLLTTRIISPDRIIEANCTPGSSDDENLFMQACDESVRTMKVAGPPSPHPLPPSGIEVLPSPGPTIR